MVSSKKERERGKQQRRAAKSLPAWLPLGISHSQNRVSFSFPSGECVVFERCKGSIVHRNGFQRFLSYLEKIYT